jgi:putative endonuclease
MHYVYIIQCKDGTLYTGWTTDVASRVNAHNEGLGAKYTKGRGPVRLLYSESFESKSDALRREMAIKKLSREDKLKLAIAPAPSSAPSSAK